jgi:uncharacterized protein
MSPVARQFGVISDTHGLLRPEAVDALEGVELILHAGDVGAEHVLRELEAIAPVKAVRGNVDRIGEHGRLPITEIVDVAGRLVCLVHILEELDIDPTVAGISAVIHGHTHCPSIERRGGVLYLNPGSAGPRRPGAPVTLMRMSVHEDGMEAALITLA